jgi:hypothetical protein
MKSIEDCLASAYRALVASRIRLSVFHSGETSTDIALQRSHELLGEARAALLLLSRRPMDTSSY